MLASPLICYDVSIAAPLLQLQQWHSFVRILTLTLMYYNVGAGTHLLQYLRCSHVSIRAHLLLTLNCYNISVCAYLLWCQLNARVVHYTWRGHKTQQNMTFKQCGVAWAHTWRVSRLSAVHSYRYLSMCTKHIYSQTHWRGMWFRLRASLDHSHPVCTNRSVLIVVNAP